MDQPEKREEKRLDGIEVLSALETIARCSDALENYFVGQPEVFREALEKNPAIIKEIIATARKKVQKMNKEATGKELDEPEPWFPG